MDFRLLGPITVSDGDRPIVVGPQQRRLLLALLVLNVNRPVRVPRILSMLWGEDVPQSARGSLHAHVSRLRSTLRCCGDVGLRTDGSSYVLTAAEDTVDINRFNALVDRARAAVREQALELYDQALRLWRGEPLSDVSNEEAREKLVRGLEELRLTVLVERVDVKLGLRRYGELVPELTGLAARFPGHARFTAQLMLTLHRAGRTTDSLDVYRRVTRQLDDRLGLVPPRELRHLQTAILADDPRLADDSFVAGGHYWEGPAHRADDACKG